MNNPRIKSSFSQCWKSVIATNANEWPNNTVQCFPFSFSKSKITLNQIVCKLKTCFKQQLLNQVHKNSSYAHSRVQLALEIQTSITKRISYDANNKHASPIQIKIQHLQIYYHLFLIRTNTTAVVKCFGLITVSSRILLGALNRIKKTIQQL